MNSILRSHANYIPATCQSVKKFPYRKTLNNKFTSSRNTVTNRASHSTSFLFPSFKPPDSKGQNKSIKKSKTLTSHCDMADVQLLSPPQQIRRTKLRRKGQNKTSSVSKILSDSVLPPTNPEGQQKQAGSLEMSLRIEISPNTQSNNASTRDSGLIPNHKTRNKKSQQQLQNVNSQDSQQNSSHHKNKTSQKLSPKSSKTKSSNRDCSPNPASPQNSPSFSSTSKRRGRKGKQHSASPPNSSVRGNSSDDESAVITSGATPHPKMNHVRSESTPRPSIERRLSDPELPLFAQTIHTTTPQKQAYFYLNETSSPSFYAGACFEKSPAPSALPIPAFTTRETFASSMPNQSHMLPDTPESIRITQKDRIIHPSTSTPLLKAQYIRSPVSKRKFSPRQSSPSPPSREKPQEMFVMDEEDNKHEIELKKQSRDLMTLLGAAKELPDSYLQYEFIDNGFVLEQIGKNLKDMLKIQC